MNYERENNLGLGIALGGMILVGFCVGAYFAHKHDLAGKLMQKYVDWKTLVPGEDEEE